ncbi:TetR/AcrR family transcriptional regulator [Actinosynnema pretiosum subsp. pretiosum]|uniref:Transcriptional regulator, TetR family n=2 Tax=Actinosynnema TaxID=40566 RepID=C6WSJ4_ACTMD|nr:TetR/AcrR family transcriptional regulator [Actinosynnema mirum]ACU40864.1 transcriptional regulator, TetR family [Actinosynnema mirum DSM 43827]AXX34377.1 transcriptional regulator, TetR family [Actinosynnema pretiosum subsp. pretiosum]QUF01929.1 TetR/AcrR family transcriptional regulator [Actinosynnema pretiosum subsp. pretiosum]
MSEATRRERLRAETERDILTQARALLTEKGRDSVTLRAIARELGITAPALYRYYDSREALLARLCEVVCEDLENTLGALLAEVPDTAPVDQQVYLVCRGFRRWALDHPQEFSLVFASTDGDYVAGREVAAPEEHVRDRFGRVFLEIAARLVASHPFPDEVPAGVSDLLHEDLAVYQQVLINQIEARGVRVDERTLDQAAIFHILQAWVRIYGHVALEVFGRFPFAVTNPEEMYDQMLAQLLGELGLRG